MGVAVFIGLILMRSYSGLLKVLVAMPLGCGIYVLVARLLRIEMLSLLTGGGDAKAMRA
jgi:hypothetical protein